MKPQEKCHMEEDLDDIIKELEEKTKKKSARDMRVLKVPTKQTREKFYTEIEHKKEEPPKMVRTPVKT